jgi:hypothetical protein
LKKATLFYLIIILLIAFFIRILLYDKIEYQIYGSEDHIIEYATALMLGIISFLLFKTSYLLKKLGHQRIISILIAIAGLAFFFGMGEEISWAQRIFDIETPARLKEINSQEELNFHNVHSYFFNATLVHVMCVFALSLGAFRLFGVKSVAGFPVPKLPYSLAILVLLVYTHNTSIYFHRFQIAAMAIFIAIVTVAALLNKKYKLLTLCIFTGLCFYYVPIAVRKLSQRFFNENIPMEYREFLICFALLFYAWQVYTHFKANKEKKFTWFRRDRSKSLVNLA